MSCIIGSQIAYLPSNIKEAAYVVSSYFFCKYSTFDKECTVRWVASSMAIDEITSFFSVVLAIAVHHFDQCIAHRLQLKEVTNNFNFWQYFKCVIIRESYLFLS